MKNFLFFACLALLASSLRAGELEAVTIPLQAYLDGHATGEARHFERAFATDAMLFGVKDGRIVRRSAADYIRASASGVAAPQVATAVIELDYPDMRAYDHMSLIRFDDGWRIVLKAFDARTP
jgi:hypothetical protein